MFSEKSLFQKMLRFGSDFGPLVHDCGSICASFSLLFRHRFWYRFLHRFWTDFGSKMAPKISPWAPIFNQKIDFWVSCFRTGASRDRPFSKSGAIRHPSRQKCPAPLQNGWILDAGDTLFSDLEIALVSTPQGVWESVFHSAQRVELKCSESNFSYVDFALFWS